MVREVMARYNKDTTIIIFDIGRNVAEPEEKNEKSFFESARECIIRIVERKIISRPNDLIGVILLGSKKTKNNLAEKFEGSFRNIEVLTELEEPNWKQLHNLPIKPTKHEGDWFDALKVTADYFKNNLYGVKCTNKKILLMTNFKSPANFGDSVEQAVQGFQDEEFKVTVIGINIYDNNLKGDDIQFARQFVEVTKGNSVTFDNIMKYLLFHRKKATRPNVWNVNLSIGPNINIPVSVYGRIREPLVKTWQTAVRDPITTKSSTDEGLVKKKQYINIENQTTVVAEDIIEGYQYGQKAIPFSETESSLLYKSGERCLSIYGFTSADNINWHNLSGNGVSYLFGRSFDNNAQYVIRCLIECLFEKNLVAIARRVYNNGCAPTMHVLFPIFDTTDDYICLSMIGLNYKEDIKNMPFPQTNIKKYTCTNNQVDAFKKLIEAMDLTCAYDLSYDDREAFPTAETVNPSIQHVLDCITFRAMNPGKTLPPPREELLEIFKVPVPIQKHTKDIIENLKKNFVLKKVEIKPKTKKLDQNNTTSDQGNSSDYIPKINIPINEDEVTTIGTIDPIGDFKTLLNKKSLGEIANDIIDVIENLIYLNFDDTSVNTKALDAIKCFRDECLKQDPTHYNEWFIKFKKDLHERKKSLTLETLIEHKLNIITKDENHLSTFTEDINKDNQIFENNTIPESAELTIPSEINDLFDEM